jgi:hypothetical protein
MSYCSAIFAFQMIGWMSPSFSRMPIAKFRCQNTVQLG